MPCLGWKAWKADGLLGASLGQDPEPLGSPVGLGLCVTQTAVICGALVAPDMWSVWREEGRIGEGSELRHQPRPTVAP